MGFRIREEKKFERARNERPSNKEHDLKKKREKNVIRSEELWEMERRSIISTSRDERQDRQGQCLPD